jgi:hypothetical protein
MAMCIDKPRTNQPLLLFYPLSRFPGRQNSLYDPRIGTDQYGSLRVYFFPVK